MPVLNNVFLIVLEVLLTPAEKVRRYLEKNKDEVKKKKKSPQEVPARDIENLDLEANKKNWKKRD